MKYTPLLFIFCFFNFNLQAQVIRTTINESTPLTCLEVDEDNYILYKNTIGHAFNFYIKNEYCDLLEIKKQETQLLLTGNVYIEINSKLFDLGIDKTYALKFPISISYEKDNPKLIIIELDMVNFISTRGYTYLIIDLRDDKSIQYAEFKEKLPVKELQPAFKKYRKSKYPITTINRL